MVSAVRDFAAKRYIGDIVSLTILAALMFPSADVLIVLLFVPLIICMAMVNSITARLLSTGAVYWLGVISYTIYLVHVPISYLLERPLLSLFNSIGLAHASSIVNLTMIVIVIMVSTASFYGIERPAAYGAVGWKA